MKSCLSDHDPLLINYKIDRKKHVEINSDKSGIKHYFRRQDEEQISLFIECLKNEHWEMISSYLCNEINVEALFDLFFKRYVNLWHFASPLVSSKSKCTTKQKFNWYSDDLRKSRDLMLGYHNVYKCFERDHSVYTVAAYRAYLFFKKQYKDNIKMAKKQTYENYIENSSNKCKAAWEVISLETQSHTNNTKITIDPNHFNNFFINSVSDIQKNITSTNTQAHNLTRNLKQKSIAFNWSHVSTDQVMKTVTNLSNSKATDFYWISNFLLRKTIMYISEPLAFIFNQCLTQGYFSDLLKVSKVIPVYKKGDKALVQNYRPISIVPIFSKVFESLLHVQLNHHFHINHLFSPYQFGFRSKKSTTTAVSTLVDNILTAFENKESVSLKLCDLSKAFDCVEHRILLDKLSYYGISHNSLNLLKSYLSNRKQYVSFNSSQSTTLTVTTGVPQGSVLGPFLFIVFINDLPYNIPSQTVIYADDTTLLSSHSNLKTLEENINHAYNSAQIWFSSNKLLCNNDKTQDLLLSMAGRSNYKSVKLLGFHLDSRLDWNDHIDGICKKISRVSFLMWKLRDCVRDEYLRISYFSFVQSHICYGIVLWGHSSAVHDILIIQKKILRTMCRVDEVEHCKPLFIRLNIMIVINLYIYQVLIHTKLHLSDFTTRDHFHAHDTRGKAKLDLPQHRLAKTGKSFKANCVRFFNRLPQTAKLIPFNHFKKTIKNWLVENPFYSLDEFEMSEFNVKF